MSEKSEHRKIEWTDADRARHRALREKFQREKPSQEDLLASGDYDGPVQMRVYLGLLETLASLRQAREAAGLSLSDVAERSGIDKASLSRLETGKQLNPTIDTLVRYATAVGKQVIFTVQDLPKAS